MSGTQEHIDVARIDSVTLRVEGIKVLYNL